jgi:Flp pilus assembly protein TadB
MRSLKREKRGENERSKRKIVFQERKNGEREAKAQEEVKKRCLAEATRKRKKREHKASFFLAFLQTLFVSLFLITSFSFCFFVGNTFCLFWCVVVCEQGSSSQFCGFLCGLMIVFFFLFSCQIIMEVGLEV